ncbi:TPA: hypothetical protein RG862_001084 [Enterobacter ludwigii]|uniref:hypothetical protein n=1 Tax=Enterobacter ludwigii TaxID=299767 RepID=UPI002151B6FB|nr:hypothetical protein [Enterobacter ludwigii]ELK6457306.1 hypothetical protein [Enterobacter ludwigii]MCR5990629.1 hypothetical protein [Enterobacter ludwigii]HDU8901897.1 hypothetical protein [Enterobacter ludwigii]
MGYVKELIYPVVFYSLIYILAFLQDITSIFLDQWFLMFAVVNTLAYPFALAFIKSLSERFVSLPHWNRSVGFICLIFALPLSVFYFLKKM